MKEEVLANYSISYVVRKLKVKFKLEREERDITKINRSHLMTLPYVSQKFKIYVIIDEIPNTKTQHTSLVYCQDSASVKVLHSTIVS